MWHSRGRERAHPSFIQWIAEIRLHSDGAVGMGAREAEEGFSLQPGKGGDGEAYREVSPAPHLNHQAGRMSAPASVPSMVLTWCSICKRHSPGQ